MFVSLLASIYPLSYCQSLTLLIHIQGNTIKKTVKLDMGDINSIVAAIDESKATRVWFTTDWYSIKNVTRAKEAQMGYNVIDAIKMRSNQIQHLVYSSGAYAGEVPTNIPEMHSKVRTI